MRLRSTLKASGTVAAVMLAFAANVYAWEPSPGWKALMKDDIIKAVELLRAEAKQNPGGIDAPVGLLAAGEWASSGALQYEGISHFFTSAEQANTFIPSFLLLNLPGTEYWSVPEEPYEADLRKVLQMKELNGPARGTASNVLAMHLQRKGRAEEAKTLFQLPGLIREWTVIGRFDNVGGVGFDSVLVPEQRISLADTLQGPFGEPVWWRVGVPINHRGWLDFNSLYEYGRGVYYAATWVKVDKEQDVLVHLGRSGALKLFTNGSEVFADDEELDTDLYHTTVRVRLNAGWNSVMLKLARWESSSLNVMVHLTNTDGTPVAGMVQSAQPQSVGTFAGKAEVLPHPGVEELRAALRKDPNNLPVILTLANLYAYLDYPDKSIELLESAKKIYPKTTVIDLYLKNFYARDGRSDDAESIDNAIKSYSPRSQHSLMKEYLAASEEKNLPKMKAMLESIDSLRYTNKLSIHTSRMSVAALEKNVQMMFQHLEQGRKAFPKSEVFFSLFLRLSKAVDIKRDDLISLIKDFIEINRNQSLYELLASQYLEADEYDDWEETMLKAIEQDRLNSEPYVDMARTFMGRQKYPEAHAILDKALAIAPTNTVLLALKGSIAKSEGKKDNALRYWQQAVRFDPYDYPTRDNLRNLLDKKHPLDLLPTHNLDSLFAATPDSSKYPGTDLIYVLEDIRTVAYEDGAAETRRDFVVKALTQRGVDYLKEYSAGGYLYGSTEVDKVYTRTKDGKEIPADNMRGSLVFKQLTPGDFIVVKTKTRHHKPGRFFGHYWDEAQFSSSGACLNTSISVLMPKGRPLQYRWYNGPELQPVKKDLDGMDLYVFSRNDVEPMKYEPYQLTSEDTYHTLQMTTIRSWKDIVDWYSAATKPKVKMKPEIRTVLDSILVGVDRKDEIAVLGKIAGYISSNIRYSSVSFRQNNFIPQKAIDVLRDRIGDCKDVSTLGIAMAREAGIESWYTLVNTKDDGYYRDPLLPEPGKFNHCIMAARTKKGTVYIDLTAEGYPLGSLPYSVKNAFALDIKDGVSSPTRLPEYTLGRDSLYITGEGILSQNGDLTIQIKQYHYGSEAGRSRNTYKSMPQDEIKQSLLKSCALVNTSTTIDNIQISHLEDNDPTLVVSYSLQVKGYASSAGSMIINKIPWVRRIYQESSISEPTRKTNMEQILNIVPIRQNITIKAPEGFSVDGLFSESHKGPKLTYSAGVTFKDGVLVADRYFVAEDYFISPDQYPDYRDNFAKMVSADEKPVVIRPITEAEKAEAAKAAQKSKSGKKK